MTGKVVIGRQAAKDILDKALDNNKASLVTVYGRRRVGKTYLIKQHLEKYISFQYQGIHNITTELQLDKFTKALSSQLNNQKPLPTQADWFDAFSLLGSLLNKKRSKRLVIFLDEFPWMQTPKSNFLAAFENFWNGWATDKATVTVIICGSAASWMIQKVVRNKGGLHNRITHKIELQPFTLYETELFLKSRNISLNHYQVIQLYMAIGGIPQYLELAQPGMSAAQIIDTACFSKNGFLYNEFSELYHALFYKAERHIKIIRVLAAKPEGLNRNQLIKAVKLQTGGTATTLFEELSAAGFITPYIPFGKKIKDTVYKLTDEYSLFYLKFMEPNRSTAKGTWQKLSNTPAYTSWSGLAFETLCIKHTEAIKKALGIAAIHTESSSWRAPGAQIDLLIDRRDQCVNLCEMKFYSSDFTIDKKYAAALRLKETVFKQQTKTRKQIFFTLVTTFGLIKNEHSIGLVDSVITADKLFADIKEESKDL
ncbi:MAG: ATP-binding protein [Ferruginibacter sp.]